MASRGLKLLSRVEALSSEINVLRSLASPETAGYVEDRLRQENNALESKIECLREKIIKQELRFGVLQYKVPVRKVAEPDQKVKTEPVSINPSEPPPVVHAVGQTVPAPKATGKPKADAREAKQAKSSGGAGGRGGKGESKEAKSSNQSGASGEGPVDVGRLDMRVGRIVEVERHPGADSLYVEKVDLGEGRLRTVVSGLVKFVPIEALQNRVGIFLCNLKPAKMRDVESEAMLMCASAPEAGGVEPLIIDSDAVTVGDSVIVPGYTHNPDDQLKPKKKIFEQVKPDLRVDQEGFATYKGARWTLKNASGVSIKAENLRDVQIA